MTTHDDDIDRLVAALGPEPEYDAGDPDAAEKLEAWRERWEPTDLDEIDWCARRLDRARQRMIDVEAVATREYERIRAWVGAEQEKAGRDATYFEGRIIDWHHRVLEDDPKAKTINLPCGAAVKSTAGRLRVEVEDPNALVPWLEEHATTALEWPEPKVKLTELAKRFGSKAQGETEPGPYPAITPEGEIVPGVKIVRGQRSHTVTSAPRDDQD